MINTKIETIYIFVVLGIYADDGTKIGSYKYDAWGNVTSTTISGTTTLQKQIVRQYNPFRYRGYYYDTQTSLYYLQSRYYDPATGRFINAEGYISTGTGLLGYNMYAYCNNNPIGNIDPSGYWSSEAFLTGVALTVLSVTMVSVAALVIATAPIWTPAVATTIAVGLVLGTAVTGLALSVNYAYSKEKGEGLETQRSV